MTDEGPCYRLWLRESGARTQITLGTDEHRLRQTGHSDDCSARPSRSLRGRTASSEVVRRNSPAHLLPQNLAWIHALRYAASLGTSKAERELSWRPSRDARETLRGARGAGIA